MKRYLLGENMKYRMAKTFLILGLLIVTLIPLISAAETTIGTKQSDDCIDLIQSCADCTYVNFTSSTMPNGTRIVNETYGIQDGTSWTANKCNLTSQLGTWIIDGHGDLEGDDTVFTYTYVVTTTGNPTPIGMPTFQMGLIIIIFAIACVFLYLSRVMGEVGFQIFFMVAALIFLFASLFTGYMVSADGNVVAGTNAGVLGLITVLGMIIIIIFAYVMIRQTINVLDYFKIKKGLKMDNNIGSGSSVGGYNTRRAY